MHYPQEFIDRVKRLLPDSPILIEYDRDSTLSALLDAGSEEVGERLLMEREHQRKYEPARIVTMLEAGKGDELLADAKILVEISSLYFEWKKIRDSQLVS